MGRRRKFRLSNYIPDVDKYIPPVLLLLINMVVKVALALSLLLFICWTNKDAESTVILCTIIGAAFLMSVILDKKHIF